MQHFARILYKENLLSKIRFNGLSLVLITIGILNTDIKINRFTRHLFEQIAFFGNFVGTTFVPFLPIEN